MSDMQPLMLDVPTGDFPVAGRYLAKLETGYASFYLLQEHAAYEVSRLELGTGTRLTLHPQGGAYQMLHSLSGLLRHEATVLAPRSTVTAVSLEEPAHLWAMTPVTLLFVSTEPAFGALLEHVGAPEDRLLSAAR